MAIGYAETYYPPGVQPQWTGALQQSDDGGNINRYAFEYTPVSKEVQAKQLEEFKRATAPGGTGDVEFNMQEAVKQLGLERAEQAMTMAMRYQGQRMYNQALKNGEDPATALAKAAPMMFYSKTGGNAGEMINALRRPAVAPITPLQQAELALKQRAANWRERQPTAAVTKEVTYNGQKFLETTQPNGTVTRTLIEPKAPPRKFLTEPDKAELELAVSAKKTVDQWLRDNPMKEAPWPGLFGGNVAEVNAKQRESDRLAREIAGFNKKLQIAPASVPNADEEVMPTEEISPAPAPAQRKENSIYKTPKGTFRWTAGGWQPL